MGWRGRRSRTGPERIAAAVGRAGVAVERAVGQAPPETAAHLGLLVASAVAPGTFAGSLSARSATDQGLITGLSTGLHYLLTVATQDALAPPQRRCPATATACLPGKIGHPGPRRRGGVR